MSDKNMIQKSEPEEDEESRRRGKYVKGSKGRGKYGKGSRGRKRGYGMQRVERRERTVGERRTCR